MGIHASACPLGINPILGDNQTSNPNAVWFMWETSCRGEGVLKEDFQEKGTFEQDDWRKHIMKALTWDLFLFFFLIPPKLCSLIIFCHLSCPSENCFLFFFLQEGSHSQRAEEINTPNYTTLTNVGRPNCLGSLRFILRPATFHMKSTH